MSEITIAMCMGYSVYTTSTVCLIADIGELLFLDHARGLLSKICVLEQCDTPGHSTTGFE